jgi:hypothetical protein
MSDNCSKPCNGKHLTVSEISQLIAGRREEAEDERLWEHLSSCDRCVKIYRESVIDCGLAETDRFVRRERPELVDEGLRIAVCKGAGASYRGKRRILSSLSALGTLHRCVAAAAAIAFIVITGIWLLNTDRAESPQMPRSVIEPVRHAVGTISRWGPIIIHGGEYAIAEKSTAYRSGFVPATNSLRSSLDYLYTRYENDTATPEGIYWLAAGYVATGQVDLARDLVADARKNGIEDLRILNLEALITYIEGDLERAEESFHSIHVLYPADAVSSINFAVVLMERGKSEESSRILTEVRERFNGTPTAQRAQVLLNTM